MKSKGNKELKTGNPKDSFNIFNNLADEYDKWFDKQGKLIFANEVAAFKNILPLLPKPWLEIGVGSGRFAWALGIEKGVEPSFKMAEIARNRGIDVFVASGDDTRFEEETFGAVFLIVTLCFLDSPLPVLKEANRILKKDGKLALGLVLKESPWGQFYLQKKAEGHRFYKYANFYSFNEVTELLSQSGFNYADTISTLFQKPCNVKLVEESRDGYYPEAGFTIMTAGKK
ncbi:MAG TPA: class I SAM-dependent methyltransferase [Dehalococcoidia bacterium]|nr:class I SAM-dependent methyltransferase [Dehalococcoidia bacterium]